MQNIASIKGKLNMIDNKDYGCYQSLLGAYEYPRFNFFIDQIPKDPYAPPHTGIYRLQLLPEIIDAPHEIINTKIRKIAFRDFLARRFYKASAEISRGRRGTGYSGIITIDEPGQAILERSSVIITSQYIEVRLFLGLPAEGRKIKSKIADQMIFDELPGIVESAFFKNNINLDNLKKHIETAEDADYLRAQLKTLGLVAFIANGAILPRKSGVSDKPLDFESTLAFNSPESLQFEIELPNTGIIRGMGIEEGITLIIGGGYHGKSTLLNAIESGIYNHIPDDGREKCVSLNQSMKIRSYSGRYVEKVDISTFIKNLPARNDTTAFSTENASGSASQAASIQEAIELGAKALLMDEDTCAANFMIRDEKMQKLVCKADEPITAFIDKTKQLYSKIGVSSILVTGGAGNYFDVSRHVIQMIRYAPIEVTQKAKEIFNDSPTKRMNEDEGCPIIPKDRIPVPNSIDPYNDQNKKRIYATEVYKIHFGKTIIDLIEVEQLKELSQTKAIGQAIMLYSKYVDGKRHFNEIIELVMQKLEKEGLDILSEKISGHFAGFRGLDLAFAINRLRGMKMKKMRSIAT